MSIMVAISPKVISFIIKAITPPRITKKITAPALFMELRIIPVKTTKLIRTTLITYKTSTSDLNLLASLLIESGSGFWLELELSKRSLISLMITLVLMQVVL